MANIFCCPATMFMLVRHSLYTHTLAVFSDAVRQVEATSGNPGVFADSSSMAI